MLWDMFPELFGEMALVMLLAGALALLAARLRQPLVIAYMVTGMLVGPVLHATASVGIFETLSRIGVAFLLFIVGLNLNWRNIRDVGPAAFLAGGAQMVITSLAGFGIALALKFSLWTSVFLGVAFAFSSTIIIVKMLTDKEDLERLYGRIAVGALIVQDLIAMMLLLVLSAYGTTGSLSSLVTFSFVKALGVVGLLLLFAKTIVPRVFAFAAKNQELLFLLAISWCFGLAGALHVLGFGLELGALLAGIALAGSGFQHEIEAKVRFVRDFFLIIFFIVLGTQISFAQMGDLMLPSLAFAAFVIIGNPLIMLMIMRGMGYHPRTGFLAGISFAQISEFSFILIGGGISAGLVEAQALPLATMLALVTIAISSYLITYNEHLFSWLSTYIPWLRGGAPEKDRRGDPAPSIVLLGYDRMGREILPMLKTLGHRVSVMDFNPAVVQELERDGISVMYGDAGSEDALKLARVLEAKMLISTIPDSEVNAAILDVVKSKGAKTITILTVKKSDDAARCYLRGADFVIIPSVLGGAHFASLLKKAGLARRSWGGLAKKYYEE